MSFRWGGRIALEEEKSSRWKRNYSNRIQFGIDWHACIVYIVIWKFVVRVGYCAASGMLADGLIYAVECNTSMINCAVNV